MQVAASLRYALLAAAVVPALLAQGPLDSCRALKHHGRMAEANSCYEKLTASANPAVRAEGFWALRSYKQASEQFRAAVAAQPKNASLRVRWGRLFFERFNPKDAQDLFKEALEIDPKFAPAYLGMALVASEMFESKAVELAEKAIELDPKLVEAQELLAKLALEDNNFEKAAAEAKKS